jgi:hypothetical protein
MLDKRPTGLLQSHAKGRSEGAYESRRMHRIALLCAKEDLGKGQEILGNSHNETLAI